MKKIIAKIAILTTALSGLVMPLATKAVSEDIDFEPGTYAVGNIHGQDGWSKTGPYDAAVVGNIYGIASFETQSLRISNGIASGSFGDQTFSKPILGEAGETVAENGAMSVGPRTDYFEAEFDIATTMPGEQSGLFISVSPDRGDGARMSYVGFQDEAAGTRVIFYDYQDVTPTGGAVLGDANGCGVGDDFVAQDSFIITRGVPHSIKFVMNFVDGSGNDEVEIYIDDALVYTGTSWEDYFRYCEGNETRTVDSLLFRAGGSSVPANLGNGYLVDNMFLANEIPDEDGDGVADDADFCPTGTTADSWEGEFGTNRWELNNNNQWEQKKPKGGIEVSDVLDINSTYGCSGEQIIALVSGLTGEDMEGHIKYGLSTSVLNEFIEDGLDGAIDGINATAPVETVIVPASDVDGVSSLSSLLAGKNYKFKASGTADAGDGIEFDADYSFRTPTSVTWTDDVSTYEYLGDELLDLQVDGATVGWDNDAVYNPDHTYWLDMAGAGLPVSFQVYDVYYPNNIGNLQVDIYVQFY